MKLPPRSRGKPFPWIFIFLAFAHTGTTGEELRPQITDICSSTVNEFVLLKQMRKKYVKHCKQTL